MKVDNFTLEQFICLAKGNLRINQHLVPLRRKPSLSFGGVVHTGMAVWYRTHDEKKVIAAIDKHWPDVLPSDDFRTKAYAMKVMALYMMERPTESWKLLEGPSGPIVEQAFTIDTGMMLEEQYWADDPDGGKILYGGIIDLGVEFNDSTLYVVDHKTTTRLGDGTYYFLSYKPDNQMTGYIWGLRKLTNRVIGGAIINAIGLYKSGEVKFKRQITTRNDFEIAEWLDGVRVRCNRIAKARKENTWPLETSQCMNYGQCEYHDIHVLNDPVAREKRLEQDYVKSEWNYEDRDE